MSATCTHHGRSSLGWLGGLNPCVAHEGGMTATVDGVFYNGRELGDGATPATQIIRLYQQHGFAGALRRINGDFAIALSDEKTG